MMGVVSVRALITGITGFVGSHLAEHLLAKGYEVYGTSRWRSKMENVEHLQGKAKFVECDMRDAHSVEKAVSQVEPEFVFHLAAQSYVPTSWHAPAETLETNIIGTVNVLEAVRKAKIDPRIQICGSSEEYGIVLPEETPIKETNPLRPNSPYAVSKIAEDFLGYQYWKSYGLKCVRTRAFNHTGPRRGDVFVTSNFSKQIVEIEKGLKPPLISVGNLASVRDFTDVRDMVRAYELSLQKCDFGDVYNICSGKGRTIQQVLDLLLSMSRVKVKVEVDPTRLRPSDNALLLGDCTKFKEKTGWRAEIPFEKTMRDLMDYWRDKIRA